jgi:hypothetical protein
VASTRPGTAVRQLARHAPGLLDRAVAAGVARLASDDNFSGAALSVGLRERHLNRPDQTHREEQPA